MISNNEKGNLSLLVARIFSGLNPNALKYLIPTWMSPLTGAFLRLSFGTIAFWLTSFFVKDKEVKKVENTKEHNKLILSMFIVGFVTLGGFMIFYLGGIKYTTPVSSSIIITLIPIWVFIWSILRKEDKLTKLKLIGIIIGFGGAILNLFSKRPPELASNPLLGDLLVFIASFLYSWFFVASHNFLKKTDIVTLQKWSFLGGTVVLIIALLFTGFDISMFSPKIEWVPFLILAFVLIFPTYISYFLVSIGLKYLKTTVVAIYEYEIIVVSTIASLILKQDVFSFTQLTAIIFLILGVYLVKRADTDKQSQN